MLPVDHGNDWAALSPGCNPWCISVAIHLVGSDVWGSCTTCNPEEDPNYFKWLMTLPVEWKRLYGLFVPDVYSHEHINKNLTPMATLFSPVISVLKIIDILISQLPATILLILAFGVKMPNKSCDGRTDRRTNKKNVFLELLGRS